MQAKNVKLNNSKTHLGAGFTSLVRREALHKDSEPTGELSTGE